jgi:hypothetical protein
VCVRDPFERDGFGIIGAPSPEPWDFADIDRLPDGLFGKADDTFTSSKASSSPIAAQKRKDNSKISMNKQQQQQQ